MSTSIKATALKSLRLTAAALAGILIVAAVLLFASRTSQRVHAAPIEPPEGHPKLSASVKTVTPTLALPGGETLYYRIEIRNTGAYTAENVTLSDPLPAHTTYNDDAQASRGDNPSFSNGTLTWEGQVGFDETVVVMFSVDVQADYMGPITNTAVIDQPQIDRPVEVSAETLVTDQPVLTIQKTSAPTKPGPDKPLTYTLTVRNIGQPAEGLTVNVADTMPADTTFRSVGPDGSPPKKPQNTVTWERNVSLDTGETSVFTFSVNVKDVPSGTVISNDNYQVSSPALGSSAGEVYTTTVIDPIFLISKETYPHPPGSNREMTYTLSVLNKGSLATGLVITDRVPTNVAYLSGGTFSSGVVTWELDKLDSGESAQVSYTVYIDDIAEVFINNDHYGVCSAEGVCQQGIPLDSMIRGPNFDTQIWLDPVAKKPGGGTGPVTPTIVIQNLGPGSALDASVMMYFRRISISLNDMLAIPDKGSFFYGPDCGEKCDSYRWVGDLSYGEVITLTTIEGQSTQGGEAGTHYTATVVITDTLGPLTTDPFTTTRIGVITKTANLLPTKLAPPEVGAGQSMTYTIRVYNSGLSTDEPLPWLTETIPLSTSLMNVSDEGVTSQVGDRTMISWTLPAMGPGEVVQRSFSVLVDDDLVSGTQIINDNYGTIWHNQEVTGTLTHSGEPITTVVKEVGLVDSFKTVEPGQVLPGEGNLLTYTVHVVNSGPSYLRDVQIYDLLPWEGSTYQRDAVASAGEIISDIISVGWHGDLAPYSSELITMSVLVDGDFEGPLTNTATIKHSSLLEDVVVDAVAYVTDKPVLNISKTASPDPVKVGDELQYRIRVENLGQQATGLVVTDSLPSNVTYLQGSVSSSGQLMEDYLEWHVPVLDPGEVRYLTFQVEVTGGDMITNQNYGVTCSEGVSATGPPLTTQVIKIAGDIYLPLIVH
jgi:uncharacterized repeat protein (TIGR01451 family)